MFLYLTPCLGPFFEVYKEDVLFKVVMVQMYLMTSATFTFVECSQVPR